MPAQSLKSPNFSFLEEHHPSLVGYAAKAEGYVFDDPDSALFKLRVFAERLSQWIAADRGIEVLKGDDFKASLYKLSQSGIVPRNMLDSFHALRKAGNYSVHPNDHPLDALWHLQVAHKISVWFFREYHKPSFQAGPFKPPPKPEQATKELEEELIRMREQVLEAELAKEEADRRKEEAERGKEEAEHRLKAAAIAMGKAERTAEEERQYRILQEKLDKMTQSALNRKVQDEQALRKAAEAKTKQAQVLIQAKRRESQDRTSKEYEELAKGLSKQTEAATRALEAAFTKELKKLRQEFARKPLPVAKRLTDSSSPHAVNEPMRISRQTLLAMVGALFVCLLCCFLLPIIYRLAASHSTGQSAQKTESDSDTRSKLPAKINGASSDAALVATNGPALRANVKKHVRVRGTVTSVTLAPSGKGMFVNFGPVGQDCLIAWIFAQDFTNWQSGGDGIREAYLHKDITIDGEIELYRDKPRLVINSPSQVTFSK